MIHWSEGEVYLYYIWKICIFLKMKYETANFGEGLGKQCVNYTSKFYIPKFDYFVAITYVSENISEPLG